ncbi:MAG: hypothetical protein ABFS43_20300, partial [Thermodesulfobacteriota bacterium]
VDDNKLNVEATSALGKEAGLSVEGYGPMKWSRKMALWSLSVSRIAANPGLVIVSGVEGSDFATPVEVSGGGGNGKGKPEKK